jgi:hypothetical protein
MYRKYDCTISRGASVGRLHGIYWTERLAKPGSNQTPRRYDGGRDWRGVCSANANANGTIPCESTCRTPHAARETQAVECAVLSRARVFCTSYYLWPTLPAGLVKLLVERWRPGRRRLRHRYSVQEGSYRLRRSGVPISIYPSDDAAAPPAALLIGQWMLLGGNAAR